MRLEEIDRVEDPRRVAIPLLVATGLGLVGTLVLLGPRLVLVNWITVGVATTLAAITIWWLAREAGRRDALTSVLLLSGVSGAIPAVLNPVAQLLSGLPPGVGFQEVAPADQALPGAIAVVVLSPFWVPSLFLLTTYGLLLFPDGRLVSPRWRWVGRTALVGMALIAINEILIALPGATVPYAEAEDTPFAAGWLLIMSASLASLASLIVRHHRADGVTRHQIRWLIPGGLVTIVLIFLAPDAQGAGQASVTVGILAFFAAYGVAVLKYRLFDIDVVISRTLLAAGLAGFIGAVYVGIVVGVGALLGTGDEPNVALSIIATAVVAVAFQPVRVWMSQVANRLVYGERATPYEVLAGFARRSADASDRAELLPRVARLLCDGTGAARAVVWLAFGDELEPAAIHPEDAQVPRHDLWDEDLGGTRSSLTVPVEHDGELLGAVTLTKDRVEPITAQDGQLVRDLAGGIGLALRNTRLTAELRHRIEQLQASRHRLVEASDVARRQVEREIEAGPQRILEEIQGEIRDAGRLAAEAGATRTLQVIDQLQADAEDATRGLREFARGVYPPVLEAQGLGPALRARVEGAALPVTVHARSLGRYPRDVESAVYFTVLEALQNAAKHAEASSVHVSLHEVDDVLYAEVTDDGTGFDPTATIRGAGLENMNDRMDAIGGSLSIASQSQGTTVRAAVPLDAARPGQSPTRSTAAPA